MAKTNDAHGVTSAVKIEALERQRGEWTWQNAEKDEEIKKLRKEIEELLNNGAEKEAAAIAARAAELETEVARHQHDMISEMSAAEEAKAELRKVLDERESRVEILEREVKRLKLVNAEREMKVMVLERKLGVVEVKEIEERSKRIRLEEEMRDKVDERERTIEGFKSKTEELEKLVMEKKIELEKWVKEKKNFEEKAKIMELSIVEAEKVIRTMKEKKGNNGTLKRVHGEVKEMDWPTVIGGSAGFVTAVYSLFYLCSGPGKYR